MRFESATGDIVPIGAPMSYDEFLDDVINDYERFVKNRYTPTDNIKAKIAARNQSLVTRGVNAIKQADRVHLARITERRRFWRLCILEGINGKSFRPAHRGGSNTPPSMGAML